MIKFVTHELNFYILYLIAVCTCSVLFFSLGNVAVRKLTHTIFFDTLCTLNEGKPLTSA